MGKRVFKLLSYIWNSILDIIFPPKEYCINCNEYDVFGICKQCLQKIKRVNTLNEYISYAYYSNTIKTLIFEFKYKGNFLAGEILTEFLVDLVNERNMKVDLVTYIPCSKKKISERGFNQSEVLAEGVANHLGVPCVGLLKKNDSNLEQKKLSRELREENISGKYQFIKGKSVMNKVVMVIDDVVTTGSTINECARILYDKGAHKIEKVTVACGEIL